MDPRLAGWLLSVEETRETLEEAKPRRTAWLLSKVDVRIPTARLLSVEEALSVEESLGPKLVAVDPCGTFVVQGVSPGTP